jgi:cell wall-associated NlpC family hydrolase
MYNEVSHTVSLQVLDNGSSENDTIDTLLEIARSKLGKPYDHNHNFGPNSFDCIGFTYWCYKQVGVKLKDSTSKQANDSRFMEVSYDELAPGDLVYFHTDSDPDVSHASIYLGNGEIIHASSTAGQVIISQLVSSKSDYYKRNFHCARRVFT